MEGPPGLKRLSAGGKNEEKKRRSRWIVIGRLNRKWLDAAGGAVGRQSKEKRSSRRRRRAAGDLGDVGIHRPHPNYLPVYSRKHTTQSAAATANSGHGGAGSGGGGGSEGEKGREGGGRAREPARERGSDSGAINTLWRRRRGGDHVTHRPRRGGAQGGEGPQYRLRPAGGGNLLPPPSAALPDLQLSRHWLVSHAGVLEALDTRGR